jgi:flagellar basal-body rod modification protein FlgD
MDIASATSAAQSKSSSTADKGLADLAENFENFLTILTTQLQYQDPLDPMDSSEFTNQLVQFTGVEQAVAQNQSLDQIVSLISSDKFLGATGYIGKTVEASGSTTEKQNGVASWTYTLPNDANSVNLTIRNSDGQEVAHVPYETEEGNHDFVWDGRGDEGLTLPDGQYHLTVDAKTFGGEAIHATMKLNGVVTGVESTDSGEILRVGDLRIPASSVTVVKEAPLIVTQ